MEGVSKTQQRVLTAVGVVVGLLVGFVIFRRIMAPKEGIAEIGDFLLAVFIGGAVGMIIYTLIKDGIPRLLKLRGRRSAAPPKPVEQPAPRAPEAAAPAAPRRKEPLRAAGRERPLRTDRPLKPRD